MYRVVPEQVAQLKPYFSARPPANAPMLQAFFEHRAPGHAYVNDVRAPTACVVAVHHRFVFFGGEVSPHFHEAALRELRRTQTLQVVAPARGSRLPRRPVPDAEVHRVEFYRRPDPDRARVRAIQRASAALGEVRRIDAALFNRCAWRDEIIHLLGLYNDTYFPARLDSKCFLDSRKTAGYILQSFDSLNVLIQCFTPRSEP